MYIILQTWPIHRTLANLSQVQYASNISKREVEIEVQGCVYLQKYPLKSIETASECIPLNQKKNIKLYCHHSNRLFIRPLSRNYIVETIYGMACNVDNLKLGSYIKFVKLKLKMFST